MITFISQTKSDTQENVLLPGTTDIEAKCPFSMLECEKSARGTGLLFL